MITVVLGSYKSMDGEEDSALIIDGVASFEGENRVDYTGVLSSCKSMDGGGLTIIDQDSLLIVDADGLGSIL